MKETISLKEILMIMLKRWKLIIFITIVAGISGASITYFVMTPVYKASTQILVNQKDANIQLDASQLRNHIELINTYSEIIKSQVILEKVIDNLDLAYSVEQLNQKITVSRNSNSVVFTISVIGSNEGMSVDIANNISETFQQEIKQLMNIDNVNILAKAKLKENSVPISPQPILNIAVAIVFGLMVGTGMSILLEFFDSTLKNPEDIEHYLDVPVLGSVQKIRTKKGNLEYAIQQIGAEKLES